MKGLSAAIHCCLLLLPCLPALVRAQASGPAPSLSTASQAEIAKLSYHDLIKLARNGVPATETAIALAPSYRMLISSTQGADTGAIRLRLETKQGTVAVPVDGQGFFEVPVKKEWLEENPFLVSNQPKGSLQLRVMIPVPEPSPDEIPKVVDGKVKYRALFDPVLKMTLKLRELDPAVGDPGGSEFAVELVVGESPVKVLRGLGARTLPNWKGSVWMLFDPVLHQENPDIAVPEKVEVRLRLVPAEVAKKIRDSF